MDYATHQRIVGFIWSIADDCLRDVFVRGKYRDVILPMFVLRRLDCLLEPTKDAVLQEVEFQTKVAKLTTLDSKALQNVSGYVFYNTSKFTLKALKSNPSQLLANFENYLDGFSDNVKEIIDCFDLRSLAKKMDVSNVLFEVIEKFVSEDVNLGPDDKRAPDGRLLPGLSNLGMGYVFEELIRRFNEENNEEAGEHFTPREVINLMTHIVFMPVKDDLPSVITVYDPACGSGGMLTEAQNVIIDPETGYKEKAAVYLFGKEVNAETYAICKSDMMIKGNNPENIKLGSTLSTDEFSGKGFDFMLSNPPYGKSWKTEQKYIKDAKTVIDPRFRVLLSDYWGMESEQDATPRSSDGQLLFLMEMVSKMRSLKENPNGSRIASVHNGSSLFTGDAGGGESNIRRHVIENDWLEAIIQLPNNMFYNTGITTYIWILTNNKPQHRRGKVQLINASEMYRKLRKNLGQKNCEFSEEHIEQITRLYLDMPDEGVSKVFDNQDFGYYKVTVERPRRLASQFTDERIEALRYPGGLEAAAELIWARYGQKVYEGLGQHKAAIEDLLENAEIELKEKDLKKLLTAAAWHDQRDLIEAARRLQKRMGDKRWLDFNAFESAVEAALKAEGLKLGSIAQKQLVKAVSVRDEGAQPVVKKRHKLTAQKLVPLLAQLRTSEDRLADYGYWPTGQAGEYIEYEPDSEARDTENVPLKEDIHAYFVREVRPHVADAWLNVEKTQIGYEISFNRYFYQHEPLRPLEEVTREILELEAQTEGLLKKLVSLTETESQPA